MVLLNLLNRCVLVFLLPLYIYICFQLYGFWAFYLKFQDPRLNVDVGCPGREAGIAGQWAQSCGSWMLLRTCWVPVNVPLRVAFFSFRAGNLAQILNVFRSIWRTFTAVSLKTLCQQLPSSVAPTFHELFILLCVPLRPAEGQEGEGQPAQCLPCSHASSWTWKGIVFCPNFLDHSLHQGQLYHECMLHDRVPFQYHVIWLWTKARPSLSFLHPEVQPRLWRTGWGLHQFVV